MKALLSILSLLTALSLLVGPARSQPADPRPDLVITGVTTSASRVAVGESFTYAVTARNNGRSPCNWLNISMALPGAVNLTGTASSGPLTCAGSVPVRIIGEPMVQICRGGPGFFLWPGQSVTTTYTVQALRVASNVTATATVDPGNVCFEARESNNTGTSPPSTFFKRPHLVVSQNRPYAPVIVQNRPGSFQDFPVTITNSGEGPAINIAFAMSVPFVRPDLPYAGPQLVAAYKGALLPAGQTPARPIPPDCGTSRNNSNGSITQICVLQVVLQPAETLQVVFRTHPCPSPTGIGLLVPVIHVGTADDLTPDNQIANLYWACRL
ncbi:MAG: hypothetical protein HYZ40_09190 [Rhodospirillales bacterium]|nr:hypothetical protein [Rhodospirillales bacterium]